MIDVEVDYSGVRTKEDCYHTVWLPDAAVRESHDRVRSAIKNSGFDARNSSRRANHPRLGACAGTLRAGGLFSNVLLVRPKHALLALSNR